MIENSWSGVHRDRHLLGNLEPGLLEAENRAAVQRGRDFEHGVVVVQAAADVSHGNPFFYNCYPSGRVVATKDLRGNQVAYLGRGQERRAVLTWHLNVCLYLSMQPTSLKCLVVLMMYGVFSFLSFFIQPCPKNSLQSEKRKTEDWLEVLLRVCSWTHTAEMCCHSLVWDDFKHQVVQQSELLRDF